MTAKTTGKVKPIPDNFPRVTPFLMVKDAARAVSFYEKAFGAKEAYRLKEPGGRIGYCELAIGDSKIMLSDEYPEMGMRAPSAPGSSPVVISLYVEDVDRTLERAIAAGATPVRPAQDEFYGDRAGMLADPFGHSWHIATRIENVAPDEMQRRFEAVLKEKAGT
jgi:PhnB protein